MTCKTTHYSGCDCHEAGWNKILTQTLDDLFKVVAKMSIYEVALEEIANQDFRGNRPHSAIVAFNALTRAKEIGE
jgi:hypothetical protein